MAIAAITNRCGNGVVVKDELPRQTVNFFRGDAGLHMRGQHVEAFRGEASGFAHAFEIFRAVKFYGAFAGDLLLVEGEFGHHVSFGVSISRARGLRRKTPSRPTSQS